jgi:hexosaminidase
MTSKNQKISVLLIILISACLSCKQREASDLTKAGIIPKPVSITATGDYFMVEDNTVVYFQSGNSDAEATANYLAGRLRPATGFALEVKGADATPQSGIYLSISDSQGTGDESYEINISKKLLHLSSGTAAGLYMGVQTVRQLFPAAIESSSKQEGKWEVATGTIKDKPVYAYRGMMLDVSRHFFGPEDVKKLIEEISYYKINMLHLHLSDDQGWRIEIKSWPNLAQHGGSTEVGGGEGGFYTQEQYSDLVKFAKQHFITIVPEIDMPGHTNAALASYPELNCNGKATDLYTGIEVGFSSFCTNKDVTYKFIDDVVKEISDLTDGPYFHIGGDESHSTKKEDYIPFIEKVQDIVVSHNKKVIGWDDIAISTLKPNTFAQHWANIANAGMAVKQGAKIIMSPAKKAYLDMQYNESTKLGLHWAAYVEVDSSYMWDPATLTPGISRENILGVEAPLWTETITNMDDMEYMVFPRLPGIAEIGWTPSDQRNWNEYRERLATHGPRFKAMGINYYASEKVPWK